MGLRHVRISQNTDPPIDFTDRPECRCIGWWYHHNLSGAVRSGTAGEVVTGHGTMPASSFVLRASLQFYACA
jgi:hypothetical protein